MNELKIMKIQIKWALSLLASSLACMYMMTGMGELWEKGEIFYWYSLVNDRTKSNFHFPFFATLIQSDRFGSDRERFAFKGFSCFVEWNGVEWSGASCLLSDWCWNKFPAPLRSEADVTCAFILLHRSRLTKRKREQKKKLFIIFFYLTRLQNNINRQWDNGTKEEPFFQLCNIWSPYLTTTTCSLAK